MRFLRADGVPGVYAENPPGRRFRQVPGSAHNFSEAQKVNSGNTELSISNDPWPSRRPSREFAATFVGLTKIVRLVCVKRMRPGFWVVACRFFPGSSMMVLRSCLSGQARTVVGIRGTARILAMNDGWRMHCEC